MGFSCVAPNCQRVVDFAGTHRVGPLRAAFQTALSSVQPARFPLARERIGIEFEFEPVEYRETLQHLRQAGPLDADFRVPAQRRQAIEAKIESALDLIERVDPDFAAGLKTAVGAFLISAAPIGGGGVSDVLGAIWLAPHERWTVFDYAELIVHEHVHQCLFLDDMVRKVFTEPLAVMQRPDALAVSAVLQQRRDFDKAFHSAFVAHALVRFNESLGLRFQARTYLGPLLRTLPELCARPHLLTPRGQELLDQLVTDTAGLTSHYEVIAHA